MAYLVTQIVACLVLAGLIGLVLGWLVRSWGVRDRIADIEKAWEHRTAALGAEHDTLVKGLERQLTEASQLVDARDGAVSALQDQVAEKDMALRGVERDVTRLTHTLTDMESALQTKTEQYEFTTTELETWRSKLEEARRALQSQEAAVAKLTADAKGKDEVLHQAQHTVEEWKAKALEAEDKIAAREATLASLRDELGRRTTTVARLEEDIAAWKAKLPPLQDQVDQQSQAVSALQRELKDKVGLVATRERERDEARRRMLELEQHAQQREVELAALRDRESRYREQSERLASFDAARDEAPPPSEPPRGLFTDAPPGTDDLQAIRGIGPVLERTLNALGVYLYRQIAGFDARDIQWVASHLNTFPDRIARDQWVDQARRLHRDKYGAST